MEAHAGMKSPCYRTGWKILIMEKAQILATRYTMSEEGISKLNLNYHPWRKGDIDKPHNYLRNLLGLPAYPLRPEGHHLKTCAVSIFKLNDNELDGFTLDSVHHPSSANGCPQNRSLDLVHTWPRVFSHHIIPWWRRWQVSKTDIWDFIKFSECIPQILYWSHNRLAALYLKRRNFSALINYKQSRHDGQLFLPRYLCHYYLKSK
jgi:hypothetical protein